MVPLSLLPYHFLNQADQFLFRAWSKLFHSPFQDHAHGKSGRTLTMSLRYDIERAAVRQDAPSCMNVHLRAMFLVHIKDDRGRVNKIIDVSLGIHDAGFHDDDGGFAISCYPAEDHHICGVFLHQMGDSRTLFTAGRQSKLRDESMRKEPSHL
jgi:hypothetical protein